MYGLTAIDQDKSGTLKPQTVEELFEELGIDDIDDETLDLDE